MSHDMRKPTMWPSVTRGLRSNQPSLRMKKCWDLGYSLSAQQRLWSDWVDTQADQGLRWAHTYFCWFVMSWIILMCLFIQIQEEIDVATVELKKIIYITLKGVRMGVGVIVNTNKSWY